MSKYKKDFPIFKKNPKLVYLDSAATSQKPQIVLQAMQEYYVNYNANVRRGLYSIAEKATAKVEEVRGQVAKFINAKSSKEIIFTRNATEGINLVAYSASHNISSRDTILTTVMEHHSNFVPWQQLAKEKGFKIKVVNTQKDFTLNVEDFSEAVSNKTKIFAVSHCSNILGTINDIKEIAKIAHENNALIVADGAQSTPHLKIDVKDLDVDFFGFSGHKMLAPSGIGALYAKKEHLLSIEPFLYGGSMISEVFLDHSTWADIPWKFEAGTPSIADGIAFGTAVKYLENIGMDSIWKHEQELTKYALDELNKIPGIKLYSPSWDKKAGVISFNLDKVHAHDIAQVLDKNGIAIRSGDHCAQPLMMQFEMFGVARASFYLYNSKEEIDAMLLALKQAIKIFA
ncbi:MAG: cysteine desulfurase [archaeon]|nr:cysteine desulfurase [archaeon]